MGRSVPDQTVVFGEGGNLPVKQVMVSGQSRQKHQTGLVWLTRRDPVVDITGLRPVDFFLCIHENTSQ